jgi:hypothetical protein
MATVTPIPSVIDDAKFRHLVLESIQALAKQVGAVGVEVTNDAGFPLSVYDHFSGNNGGKIVPATTASGAGTWYALQFVTSGTLSAYTGNLTGTVTGVTFPAGFVLYGTTTAFTPGSGTTVVAYTA